MSCSENEAASLQKKQEPEVEADGSSKLERRISALLCLSLCLPEQGEEERMKGMRVEINYLVRFN